MSLVGTAGKLGGLGLGAALLTSALGSAFNAGDKNPDSLVGQITNIFSTDTLKSVLSFGLDKETIENNSFMNLLSNFGGPAAGVLGSILLYFRSNTLGKWGLVASLGWLAYEGFKTLQKTNFNMRAAAQEAGLTLEQNHQNNHVLSAEELTDLKRTQFTNGMNRMVADGAAHQGFEGSRHIPVGGVSDNEPKPDPELTNE